MTYKRGGVWWYEFRWRGQRVREAGGRTKAAARVAESLRRAGLASGTGRVQALPVLAEACRLTQAERQMSDRNRQDNARLQATVCRAMGKLRLDEIGPREVERYRKARLESVSPATVNREVSALRVVMRRWGQWERVAARLHQLREAPSPGRALGRSDEARLLAVCGPRLRAMVLLSVETGMRASELRRLRWEDVSEDRGSLLVRRSKTEAGTNRTVPLTTAAGVALGSWPGDGLVFGWRGRECGSWKTAWRAALRRAGLELRWHDLRHTAATRMLGGGAPLVRVAEVLGWSGATMAAMARRYAHILDAEGLRGAVEAAGHLKIPAQSPQKSPQPGMRHAESMLKTA